MRKLLFFMMIAVGAIATSCSKDDDKKVDYPEKLTGSVWESNSFAFEDGIKGTAEFRFTSETEGILVLQFTDNTTTANANGNFVYTYSNGNGNIPKTTTNSLIVNNGELHIKITSDRITYLKAFGFNNKYKEGDYVLFSNGLVYSSNGTPTGETDSEVYKYKDQFEEAFKNTVFTFTVKDNKLSAKDKDGETTEFSRK